MKWARMRSRLALGFKCPLPRVMTRMWKWWIYPRDWLRSRTNISLLCIIEYHVLCPAHRQGRLCRLLCRFQLHYGVFSYTASSQSGRMYVVDLSSSLSSYIQGAYPSNQPLSSTYSLRRIYILLSPINGHLLPGEGTMEIDAAHRWGVWNEDLRGLNIGMLNTTKETRHKSGNGCLKVGTSVGSAQDVDYAMSPHVKFNHTIHYNSDTSAN